MNSIKTTELFDLPITTSQKEKVLEFVFSSLKKAETKLQIFTPNPEMIVASRKDASFKKVLGQAQILLPDGMGIVMAALLLGKGSISRLSGVDFLEMLCKESVRNAVTTGFLGGKGSVALRTVECLQKKYPGLKVSFVGEEWESGIWIPKEYQENVKGYMHKVQDSSFKPQSSGSIDILFVAFGHGKQEKWIAEHIEKFSFRVGMGVGGAFDYLSGEISRAPKLVRSVGLEWLYRLIRQPWRVKRQLKLLSFVVLVLRERFSKKS